MKNLSYKYFKFVIKPNSNTCVKVITFLLFSYATDFMDKYIYIYFGTIVAAMITGIVAYITLVVNKENSISSFRQDWINSLRGEISTFISLIYSYHWLMKKVKFEPDYETISMYLEDAKRNGLIKNNKNVIENNKNFQLLNVLSKKNKGETKHNESEDKYFQLLIDHQLKTAQSGFSELERVIFEIHNNYNKIKYRLNKDEINTNSKLIALLDFLYKEFNLKEFDGDNQKHLFVIEESYSPKVKNCKLCQDSPDQNYTVLIEYDYKENMKCNVIELLNHFSRQIEKEAGKILKLEWNRVKEGEKWFKRSKYAFLYAFTGSIIILAFFMILNYSKI